MYTDPVRNHMGYPIKEKEVEFDWMVWNPYFIVPDMKRELFSDLETAPSHSI